MEYLLLIAGLLLLIVSGDFLVKGAVSIALKFRISTLVVGMTVVALGTSTPELLVSLNAAIHGHADISIGNIVGSNIANIALILGITAMIFPLKVDNNSILFDWPIMMLATILLYVLALDHQLGFIEGLLFVLALISITVWMINKSRQQSFAKEKLVKEENSNKITQKPLYFNLLIVIFSCVGLVAGANWFLEGAVSIAKQFEISERVIGVTLVAFGTSVPELITSCVAAFRKQTDISIGNLIGSNLFNILGILGVTGMVAPISINEKILTTDMWWLLGISLLIFPLMWCGKKINRLKGFFLFLIYISYVIFVFI